MDGYSEPIFRGCTRPAMVMGIPMVPALVVSGVALLGAIWCFYIVSRFASLFLLLMYAPVMAWMRQVTTRDDQRLRQLLMRVRMRTRHGAGKRVWGAVSYSPIRYKKR